jgi:hypothetical protein
MPLEITKSWAVAVYVCYNAPAIDYLRGARDLGHDLELDCGYFDFSGFTMSSNRCKGYRFTVEAIKV